MASALPLSGKAHGLERLEGERNQVEGRGGGGNSGRPGRTNDGVNWNQRSRSHWRDNVIDLKAKG